MTAADEGAVQAYDQFVRRFMAHGADAAPLLKAVMDADPDLVLGHCVRGFCALILGRQELRKFARDSLTDARHSLEARGGTGRERAYVEALAAFCDGSFTEACDRLDASLAGEPRDAYAVKLVHGVRFMMGDPAGMRQSTARLLPAWDAATPDAGYVWGCHAFGLEETGAYDEAEALGRKAVAFARDDAWAFHAVAHVLEMRDQTQAGLDWLSSDAADLSATGNLAYHIYWHKALFLLDIKDYAGVLALYDQAVRANQTDDFRDVTNGISLLARLEGAGVDVGDRWTELADKAANRVEDMALVFAALHYLVALIATERWDDANRQIEAMRAVAEHGTGDQARLFGSIGLPYATALLGSYGPQQATDAAKLVPCLPLMQAIGGSHAQRDVFFRIAVDRLNAAGQTAIAQDLLAKRLELRPNNVWARDRMAAIASAQSAVTQAAE